MFKTQKLSIRWRQGGERCTPINRVHSQTVKKLLQEYQLETWLRDRVPLIYCDDQLVAVADLWLCKEIVDYVDIENNEDRAAADNRIEHGATVQISAKKLLAWSL
jgi:tRNA(Ile)-lysidine synthetase-like protein